MSLGPKARCWYLRGDPEQGLQKQGSDIYDIMFISKKMREQGQAVRPAVSKTMAIGCYHMLSVAIGWLEWEAWRFSK